jgi:GT2 family glycosyltransferase
LAKLANWAWARHWDWSETSNDLPSGISPPTTGFRVLTMDDAVQGRGWSPSTKVFLVIGGRNHGFAGGVNIGIRFALANPFAGYVWVLNNDTVVAPDCLSRMQKRMQGDREVGMCGSRIIFYSQCDVVQALGGARFQPWTGRSRLIGNSQAATRPVSTIEVERQFDHLSGVSMLVSREFLEDVGLMDESYFLYYEETDWAMRAKGRYRLAYADDALVYHKEGASIGSNHQRARRSPLSCYFLVSSRIRFTRKFFPWALPSVLTFSMFTVLRALLGGRPDQARAMWFAMRGHTAKETLGWTAD